MSAGAVRAGGVFVEIGADPRKFFSALSKVNKSLGNMGRSLASGGGKLAAAGIGMAAPIAAAVRQGAAFESTLLNIRASTGATSAQIDQIKASSMAMSQALGVGPTEAAQGMLELLKAGMSLDTVLGGAGRTAMEFAKVGEMDVAQAAVVMSDAMNVFKVSSDVAANALSSAADASSTSIAQMSEAFSMSSAVAGLANQSIEDLSATLAILANAGVKGSDAGTSVKTMLMRLMAPADDAVGALDQLGLSVASFRGADGQMRPMVEIIGTLTQAMGGLDQTAKDDIFRRIFGADAIRAASILASEGVDGFQKMREAMASALPVGEKYKMMMSGLSGSFSSVLAAMQRMAIAITDAVAPALASVVPFITGFIDGLTAFISKNKEAVAGFAKLAVAAIGIGGAMTSLGLSLQVASFAMGGIGKAAMLALSPLTMLIGAASGVGKSFALAMPETLKLANAIGSSMLKASASVTAFVARSGAAASVYASSLAGMAAATTGRLGVVAATWAATGIASSAGFLAHIKAMITYYTGALAGVQAITISRAGATAAAWITSSVGADTFANAFSASMKTASASSKFAASTVGSAATLIAQSTASTAAAASRLAAPLAAPFVAVGKSMAVFAADIVGGLTLTYKSFVWWATGASARMAQYAANLTGAVGKTIASTAAMSAAWLGSAARGVAAFVGSAVAGIGTYLAATVMAVAGSVASAAAVAAAWLAPLAPLLLLSAAAVGVGVAVKQFGPQLSSAFSGLAGYVSDAGGAISGGFSAAVSGGMAILRDLAGTATTTFSGIYEAVSAGDMAGAMEIAMAGLQAAFFDVAGPFLTQVSEWATKFQGIFDDIGVSIAVAMESAEGFFKKNVADIGNPQAWGAAPAIGGVPASSKEELARRADGIQSQTDRNVAAMEADAKARSGKRIAAASDYALSIAADKTAAKSNLTAMVGDKRETRTRKSQADELLASIQAATSLDQLGGVGSLGDQFSTLRDMGRLTSDQETMLSNALDKAAENLTGTSTATGKPDVAGMQAGADAGIRKAEVAGTFSANLGGMGFGSSLAERQLKTLESIDKNTKGMGDGEKVAA